MNVGCAVVKVEQLDQWFSLKQRLPLMEQLTRYVGLTRVRAECFLRLWVYLLVKSELAQNPNLKPPLVSLKTMFGSVVCTHREAAELFYFDKHRGSDRSAGMMLDKLAALGLIQKYFDGNSTRIEIRISSEMLTASKEEAIAPVEIDNFDPRCDAIPVANLLAVNYNWMNHNQEAIPHRIARLLRKWGQQYNRGMRVLRRIDNANPVGFYLLYPTRADCDVSFFASARKGLHLSTTDEVDPFEMATVGDESCVSVFIRSCVVDPAYINQYQAMFIADTQPILRLMQQDFPNLCDLHTLIIHPDYERLALALGFQRTSRDAPTGIHWMYLALDRFLEVDVFQAIARVV